MNQRRNKTLGWASLLLALVSCIVPLLSVIAFPVAFVSTFLNTGFLGWISAFISGIILFFHLAAIWGLKFLVIDGLLGGLA